VRAGPDGAPVFDIVALQDGAEDSIAPVSLSAQSEGDSPVI